MFYNAIGGISENRKKTIIFQGDESHDAIPLWGL